MVILQILAVINFSMARQIIIKAEDSPQFDYEKHLEEHPSHISYVQHLREAHSKNKSLKKKIKKAQFHFLEGSIDKARKTFEEISDKKWEHDWSTDEKKIIVYSILRLAQMDRVKQKQLLTEALTFDKQLPIKETLFPPPMVAEYKRIKNSLKEKVYPLPQHSDLFEKILINGELLKRGTSFFKATKGKKRFSFVSNSYKPIVVINSPEALSKRPLKPEALVAGNCQSPQIKQDFSNIPAYAFYDKNCILPARGQIQDLLPNTQYGKNMKASSNTPLKRKWKKSTWLWIGASIVGAFATYKLLEAQNKNRPHRIEIQPNNDHLTNASSQQ